MRRTPARREFLKTTVPAVGATVGVAALANSPKAAAKERPAKRTITRPGEPLTPEAILSPAVQFGNLVFVSGQTAHDPRTRKLPEGPFAEAVKQSLENLKAVLEAAGSSPERVLKCTVFLTDITNFQEMNKVYHSFFASNPPARSTMAVKDLPGGTPVEIECIAYLG